MDNLKNDDYGNVDLDIVFETLKIDIPDLLGLLT